MWIIRCLFSHMWPTFQKDICCFTNTDGYLSIKCYCFDYHTAQLDELGNYCKGLTADLDAWWPFVANVTIFFVLIFKPNRSHEALKASLISYSFGTHCAQNTASMANNSLHIKTESVFVLDLRWAKLIWFLSCLAWKAILSDNRKTQQSGKDR